MAPEGEGEAEREAEGGDAREGVRGGRGGVGHLVTGGVIGRAAGTNVPIKMLTCAKQPPADPIIFVSDHKPPISTSPPSSGTQDSFKGCPSPLNNPIDGCDVNCYKAG